VRGEKLLTEKLPFKLIFASGKSWTSKEIVIRALPNETAASRFGFVVSRRVGKAVVRNRIKRRLREIIRQTPVRQGWDVILVARIPAAEAAFRDLNQSVRKLLVRAGLSAGENENISPGSN
jgi:ribonuclease P protein component